MYKFDEKSTASVEKVSRPLNAIQFFFVFFVGGGGGNTHTYTHIRGVDSNRKVEKWESGEVLTDHSSNFNKIISISSDYYYEIVKILHKKIVNTME